MGIQRRHLVANGREQVAAGAVQDFDGVILGEQRLLGEMINGDGARFRAMSAAIHRG